MALIVRAGAADRGDRLLRRARLLTEAGRVEERLRLYRRLEAHIGRIQDQRLDLVPAVPIAYLPAREAVRRAERALREASARVEPPAPTPMEALRPRLLDRLRRRIADGPGPVAASEAASAAREVGLRARETAERDLGDARRALARIEEDHARSTAATEAGRAIRRAQLARRTALADAALALLAEDDGWTARGILALMRAARQDLHRPAPDPAPVAEIDANVIDADVIDADGESPGPGFR